ncbi:MAG: hypothetical protein AB4911_23625 [Oscillochloridaceae bacterium umkhey_bin13]
MDADHDLPEPPHETPSEELERLARETLEAQTGTLDPVGARRRCQRVLALQTDGAIIDGRDYFHAAWVMLCGESQSHFALARRFAREATSQGEARAWTLQAMAWDRWLMANGKPQRFGTQIIKQNGRTSLGPVDPSVSDEERAFYAVPPLYVQRQLVEQRARQEDRG